MSYVIGVDGGTESIRAFVFDLDGRPLASVATPYKTDFPNPSWAEQNPEDWWACMGQSVKGAVAKAGVSPADIIAMSVDTTCCSVVALDAAGKPLAPLHDLDGRALRRGSRRGRRHEGSLSARQRRRRRARLGRMDDPQVAVDEAPPAGDLRPRREGRRIPGLHQPAAHRPLGGLARQCRDPLALPDPARRRAALAARGRGPLRTRGEVAEPRSWRPARPSAR